MIDKRHVITAAHCLKVKFNRLVARLGEYDLTTDIDCSDGVCTDPLVRIQVAKTIPHPNYDGLSNDIAVLRLGEEAPYTNFIRPICLPSGFTPEGTLFSASGWGEMPFTKRYSNIKKTIPLPNWSIEKCKTHFKEMKMPENIICAGGEYGIDTCKGDSGGPLTLIKERTELWGITSEGMLECGKQGYPAFYTNVSHYMSWIKSVVNINEEE